MTWYSDIFQQSYAKNSSCCQIWLNLHASILALAKQISNSSTHLQFFDLRSIVWGNGGEKKFATVTPFRNYTWTIDMYYQLQVKRCIKWQHVKVHKVEQLTKWMIIFFQCLVALNVCQICHKGAGTICS